MRTEAVGVLHPVVAMWRFWACRICVDVVKDHISAVLNVDAPQLRLYDMKVLNHHIGYVPKHKWHGAAWSCGSWSLSETTAQSVTSSIVCTMVL
jgi:hypothetical protein